MAVSNPGSHPIAEGGRLGCGTQNYMEILSAERVGHPLD
jgi:hypothetical protein